MRTSSLQTQSTCPPFRRFFQDQNIRENKVWFPFYGSFINLSPKLQEQQDQTNENEKKESNLIYTLKCPPLINFHFYPSTKHQNLFYFGHFYKSYIGMNLALVNRMGKKIVIAQNVMIDPVFSGGLLL